MSDPTDAADRSLAIRVMMMPRDTNANGTIFGGVLLSYVDQAGAIHVRTLGARRVVTVAMDSVEFKQPVYVGDVLSFYARTISIGQTSARIHVNVEAQRFRQPGVIVHVTSAELTFVSINEDRKPTPIRQDAGATGKREMP